MRHSPVRGSLAVLLAATAVAVRPADAQSLRGSRESVDRMYQQAQREQLRFSETPDDVRAAAGSGALVQLTASNDVTLRRVAFPYVTPATKAFVARLGRQHRAECGTPLMVTSAARPTTRQPANSVAQSVHPTGMAIDLRKPSGRCLRWLRATLLELEDAGVIEATEERRPPHFHVAVFPTSYTRYAAAQHDAPAAEPRPSVARSVASRVAEATRRDRSDRRYRVRPGDTLWDIARAHETSVRQILAANRMRQPVIRPGQQIVLPARVAAAVTERESVGQ